MQARGLFFCVLPPSSLGCYWARGVHDDASARLSEVLYSHPPLIGSVPIERACGEVVMCHAPHAGTFLEKGWIKEIFNRNRENNKEMNRDNKINRDS